MPVIREVFVSYATKDRSAVIPIVEAIEGQGFIVLWDRDMSLDDSFNKDMQNELKRAHCVLVLWSKAVEQSIFAKEETRQAIEAWSSGRLVLATLDETPLPLGLRDIPAIRISGAVIDGGLSSLIDRIRFTVQQVQEGTGPAPRSAPKVQVQHHRRSSKWLAIAMICVVGLIAAATIWIINLGLEERWESPGRPGIGLPAPSSPSSPSSPVFPTELMALGTGVLVIGVVIGAGGVWIWTLLSRRRSKRFPTVARVAAPAPLDAPKVFVSYSHQDTLTVDQLVQQIQDLGYAVWIDRESSGAQRYAAQIVSAIRASRLVALMCSENAFASDHVIREIYVAGDWKKPFIAFQLDEAELPDEVLYFLSGFPRLPVAAIDDQKLRSEIARLVAA